MLYFNRCYNLVDLCHESLSQRSNKLDAMDEGSTFNKLKFSTMRYPWQHKHEVCCWKSHGQWSPRQLLSERAQHASTLTFTQGLRDEGKQIIHGIVPHFVGWQQLYQEGFGFKRTGSCSAMCARLYNRKCWYQVQQIPDECSA